MSHFSKYIAAFGVAATLGFAALPLSSYAETSVSQEVKVTVNSSLAISMKSGSSHTLTIDQNSFNDGSDSSNRIQHELEVVSNSSTGYNITLQDSDDNNDLSGPNSAKPSPLLVLSLLVTALGVGKRLPLLARPALRAGTLFRRPLAPLLPSIRVARPTRP